jgi:hypothetical protein
MGFSHNDQTCVESWDCVGLGMLDRLHPVFNQHERDEVRRLGEVAYNREKLQQALQWAAAHPAAECS